MVWLQIDCLVSCLSGREWSKALHNKDYLLPYVWEPNTTWKITASTQNGNFLLISSYQKAGCKASLSFGRIIRNLQGQEGDSKWQKKILRYFLESLYWEPWAGLFFHRRHFAKVQVGNFSNLFHIYTWVNWIRHFCHLSFSLRWFAHSFFQRATSKESFKKCSLTISKMKS